MTFKVTFNSNHSAMPHSYGGVHELILLSSFIASKSLIKYNREWHISGLSVATLPSPHGHTLLHSIYSLPPPFFFFLLSTLRTEFLMGKQCEVPRVPNSLLRKSSAIKVRERCKQKSLTHTQW